MSLLYAMAADCSFAGPRGYRAKMVARPRGFRAKMVGKIVFSYRTFEARCTACGLPSLRTLISLGFIFTRPLSSQNLSLRILLEDRCDNSCGHGATDWVSSCKRSKHYSLCNQISIISWAEVRVPFYLQDATYSDHCVPSVARFAYLVW